MPKGKGYAPVEDNPARKGKAWGTRDVGEQGKGNLADGGPEVVPSREGQRTPKRAGGGRMPLAQPPVEPKVGR